MIAVTGPIPAGTQLCVLGVVGYRASIFQLPVTMQLHNRFFYSDLSAEAARLPYLKFDPNKSNREFDEVIKKGVVLKDELGFGEVYLQSHLTKQFPVLHFTWVPRLLSENVYLLDPPDAREHLFLQKEKESWEMCPFRLHLSIPPLMMAVMTLYRCG